MSTNGMAKSEQRHHCAMNPLARGLCRIAQNRCGTASAAPGPGAVRRDRPVAISVELDDEQRAPAHERCAVPLKTGFGGAE
jgi:hypothetical protein